MENDTGQKDEIYLKIWEIEQKHTSIRWTITTFFLSVSFAIFGISLQIDKVAIPRFVPLLTAVLIYWLNYLLFRSFSNYTDYLRAKLLAMEQTGQTSLHLQSEVTSFFTKSHHLSATKWLVIFGIFYSLTTFLILWFYGF